MSIHVRPLDGDIELRCAGDAQNGGKFVAISGSIVPNGDISHENGPGGDEDGDAVWDPELPCGVDIDVVVCVKADGCHGRRGYRGSVGTVAVRFSNETTFYTNLNLANLQ